MSGTPGTATDRAHPAPHDRATAPDPDRASTERGPIGPGALDELTAGALRWLGASRASFRLPPDVATEADPNTTLKPLGELAEITHLIETTHPRQDLRDAAAALFTFAWEQTGNGALFAELVRGEPLATYPVELYGIFARAGLRDAAVEALLPTTTRLRGWRVPREDHTRTLAVLRAEHRIGLPEHADFGAVLAQTGLGQLREPWALDRRAAYGVTHDVFHATDWGRARHRLPEALADYLALWVPCWLDTWLEEEQWDLVGELLAVAACLPRPAPVAGGWRRLAGAQTADGSVPETGAPADRAADPFLACYHSTLVTAFAATLARTGADGADGTGRPNRESEAAP